MLKVILIADNIPITHVSFNKKCKGTKLIQDKQIINK